MTASATLSIRDLRIGIDSDRGAFNAVDGIDLEIGHAETLALVGQSGCGKSMTSLAVMGLLPRAARVTGGSMLFRDRDGRESDLASLDEKSFRRLRGDRLAMIFQEPMTSLNPVQTVGDQVAEVLRLHRGLGHRAAAAEAVKALARVEIADARRRADDYPHRLSGGMRQRVMIAMALACKPTLLIADEPTTALDVTVQAQILALLRELQQEMGMSILFITHNFGVVAEIADKVAVMNRGRIVEQAAVIDLFRDPRQDYTRQLLSSLPGRHLRASDRREASA